MDPCSECGNTLTWHEKLSAWVCAAQHVLAAGGAPQVLVADPVTAAMVAVERGVSAGLREVYAAEKLPEFDAAVASVVAHVKADLVPLIKA